MSVALVKSFLKAALPESYHSDIDALQVENVITPFTISDESDTIKNLVTANGGKAIMSQRESIEEFGRSSDPDKTLREITEESTLDSFALTV